MSFLLLLHFYFTNLGRILAIDYGLKRTGIAVTDPLKLIATSLTTVETINLFDFLKEYFSKESVEIIVVGLPRQMNNVDSQSMPYINEFVAKFKSIYPTIRVEMVDERFTSKIAMQTMVMGGAKKKDRQNKSMIDTISATIILQSYMESLSYRSV